MKLLAEGILGLLDGQVSMVASGALYSAGTQVVAHRWFGEGSCCPGRCGARRRRSPG